MRSEEHTSELQSLRHLVCRLLLEKKKKKQKTLHKNQDNNNYLNTILQHSMDIMGHIGCRLCTVLFFLFLFFFFFFFFFLNNRAPPNFPLFPHPALFRI